MGGKRSFESHTASSSVEHVVEVTAKRRLILATPVTPIFTVLVFGDNEARPHYLQ